MAHQNLLSSIRLEKLFTIALESLTKKNGIQLFIQSLNTIEIKMNKFLFSILTMTCLSTCFISTVEAITQDLYPFSTPTDAVRFNTLTKQIRCVVCQNQTIAESNTPIAADLRNKK